MNMKIIGTIACVALIFSSSVWAQEAGAPRSARLMKKWATPAVFKTPESVVFNRENNEIYVSNMNGTTSDKDGNGFISRLSADGAVLNLKWIEGLNSPKGMGIFNGRLFVTDLDEVVEIDLNAAAIVRRYTDSAVVSLNDIAVDPSTGVVYASDIKDTKIYSIGKGGMKVFIKDTAIFKPNGLYVERTTLYIGTKKKLMAVDMKTMDLTTVVDDTGTIDGLELYEHGSFIISDWAGHITFISPGHRPELLLDTTPDSVNAADLNYNRSTRVLLVPTFNDNRVVAYDVLDMQKGNK